jgi:hypothetical protein
MDMQSLTPASASQNLALNSDVTIEVSVSQPTGRGARDPHVLLTHHPRELEGQPLSVFLDYRQYTYDTYDGHNSAKGPDWYAIHFPELTAVNCIEITMECPIGMAVGGHLCGLKFGMKRSRYGKPLQISS